MAIARFYKNLKKDEEFLKWFWEGENASELIMFLNRRDGHHDKLRREKDPSFVYGLIRNDDIFNGQNSRTAEFNKRFKSMKIGLTQSNTDSNVNNKMEEIIKRHKHNDGEELGFIFVLMKNAVDTTPHNEFAKRVRENIGIPITADAATSLKLSMATEWVLTTQGYVRKLKNHIDAKSKKGSIDSSILKTSKVEKFKLTSENYNAFGDLIKGICKRDAIRYYRF